MPNDILVTMGSAVPITLAIIQALKYAGMNTKFLPLMSLGVGVIAGGVLALVTGHDILWGMTYGLLGGSLATSGFASVKDTYQGLTA